MKEKMLEICEEKIKSKGDNVGISFYVFFKNKNDNSESLMKVARWWIMENKLDHFEKATKMRDLMQNSDL